MADQRGSSRGQARGQKAGGSSGGTKKSESERRGTAGTAVVRSRPREQYLVTRTSEPLPQDVQPLDLDVLAEALQQDDEITFKKTLSTSRGLLGTLSTGATGGASILVAEMPADRADALRAHPQLVVEVDREIDLLPAAPPVASVQDPGVLVPFSEAFTPTLVVTGPDGTPVAGANVYVYGRLLPAQGITDEEGRVQVSLVGETASSVRGLYVKPRADHWSVWIADAELRADGDNVVALPALGDAMDGFPGSQHTGWGQKAMGLDHVPPNFRGSGVKVCVIDSGAATSHPDLAERVANGRDLVAGDDTSPSATSWSDDVIAHGSHCVGIVTGDDRNASGIRGFAPDAEVSVVKIFPGGRFSHLIEALDWCIEQHVDIASLSLGSGEVSQLVEQKIRQAREMGVACIVAAGNSAGPVQYPASSPNVLAVAALGQAGTFPAESYHATQVADAPVDGPYFSAKFTCHGPEIDVVAPGVAIVSSVPEQSYAAWDGTSMAAPHVTGLAALVLAHHPDFAGPDAPRGAARVDHLFEVLRRSAQPLDFGDPGRTGAGMPHAVAALGLGGAPVGRGRPTREARPIDAVRDVLAGAGLVPGRPGRPTATAPERERPDPLARLGGVLRGAGLVGGGAGAATPQPAAASPSEGASARDPLRTLAEVLGEAGLVGR